MRLCSFSKKWTYGAEMPVSEWFQAAAVVGNQIWLIGRQFQALIYTPSSNTWSSGPQLQTWVNFPSAAVLNGAVYVFGAYGQNSGVLVCSPPASPEQNCTQLALSSGRFLEANAVVVLNNYTALLLGGLSSHAPDTAVNSATLFTLTEA